jgi:membrane-associated phospholipid phosphatase
MEYLQDLSIAIIQALQTLSPVLDGMTRFFSFIGAPGFYILLVPMLYWTVDKRIGKTALLALALCAFLGLVLKQLLHLPRPYWLGEVKCLTTEATYGAPSSNASDSLAVLGYLAYRLNKAWLWAVSGLMIGLIGLSRLYLGVQFPLGVVSGWLVGLGVVLLLLKVERLPAPGWTSLSWVWQVAIGFVVSILVILAGYVVGSLIAPSPDPASWTGYATQARSLWEYFAIAGGIAGGISGVALVKTHADFQTQGTLVTKACRCFLGFAGLGAIYFGLGGVLNLYIMPETVVSYILRYIQVASMGLWILFGAPWLFVKLKFAAVQWE